MNIVQPVTTLDVSFVTYITHEEVHGERYVSADLVKDLSQLSVEDCLLLISRILISLDNGGYLEKRIQLNLALSLFDPAVFAIVENILTHGKMRVLFFETQLLALSKYAVLYAKHEKGSNFNEGKLYPAFARALLGITDILIVNPNGWSKTELQQEAIRNYFFLSSQDFKRSISRTQELFVHIPQKLSHRRPVDLQATFQEATGLPLEDFIDMGFAIVGQSMLQKPGNYSDEFWTIDRDSYFSKSNLSKEEMNLLFKEYSTTTGNLASKFSIEKDSFIYDYDGLVQHPLVTFDEHRYFVLSQRYAKEKFTRQIYWILFDYIKIKYSGNDKKQREYSSFMGAIFEEYVHQIFRRIFPASSTLIPNRLIREKEYKGGKTVDNIVLYHDRIILIETKISQLKIRTGVLGDLDDFKDDVVKIIVRSLDTIQRTKDDFKKGLFTLDPAINPNTIREYVPVIVTYGMFPTHPLLWEIVEDVVNKNSKKPIDRDILDNLQIIDVDELEVIEQLITGTPMTLLELIANKNANNLYKRLPFSNFLSDMYPDSKVNTQNYLSKIFDNVTNRMTIKLFGKPLEWHSIE